MTVSAAALHLSRRRFFSSLSAAFGLGAVASAAGIRIWDRFQSPFQPFWQIVDQVTPAGGVKTSVSFGDSIQKLVAAGVIDPNKLRSLYRASMGLPEWVNRLLAQSSPDPIILSAGSAPYLLNLLWPLGIATKASFNEQSPINTVKLPSFASTAGWSLGKESNGAAYFNKIESLRLTEEQERRVLQVAQNSFRPCCDNSTYFQDCNHGSALFGLLELAASNDTTTDQLYRLALAANSYWFPDYYKKTALYLAVFEGQYWKNVSPELVLGPRFSSLSGWQRNVNMHLRLVDFMSRGQMEQGTCAV